MASTRRKIKDSWHYGKIAAHAKPFYVWYSKPLAEQIIPMNKNSNNLMARQVFLTIGAEKTGSAASLLHSRQAFIKELKNLGIDVNQIYIDNGAGLSRTPVVTAEQLGVYLQKMSQQKVFTAFIASLPIAGVDGTLRKRFKGTPLRGNLIGKTGTLKDVKTIAGYMTTKSGRKTAFAILVDGNRFTGQLQDEILLWLYNQY